MNTKKINWRKSARIIWAIFTKDVLEAIKNKTTITVLISSLFIVVMYKALPTFEALNEPVNLLVFDQGNSTLVEQLQNNQEIKLYTYPSEDKLRSVIVHGDIPEFGLIIPADFNEKINASETVHLQGLILHWVSPKDTARLENTIRQEFNKLFDADIQWQTETVYMKPDAGGIGVFAGLGILVMVAMIGLTLIPHLMLEEKKSKTLDALQVSPASAWELATAKALVGLFYCLLAAGIGLGMYYRLILHWGLAILTIIIISLFVISLGLWFGLKFDDISQLTIFAWVFIIPLFFPMIIMLLDSLFPEIVIQIASWVPTSAALMVMRSAFAQPLDLIPALLRLLYILAWVAAGMLLVIWQIGQLDRKEETKFELPKVSSKSSEPTAEMQKKISKTSWERIQPSPIQKFEQDTSVFRSSSITRIFAIAGKDIRGAFKNRIMLSLIIGTAFLILPNAFLPKLLRSENQPVAVVYDPGESDIINTLSRSGGVRMPIVKTKEEFDKGITEAMGEPIGLLIPPNFDEIARNGLDIEIQAIAVRWADYELLAKWADFYAEKLTEASGTRIIINVSKVGMYPLASANGFPQMIGVIFSIGVLVLGLSVLPMLIVEEKEAHTFEALLISPANLSQIVTGKALAGMVFTLIIFSVAAIAYSHVVSNWFIVALTALVSTFFITSVGLLIGIKSNNPATTNLWSGLVILLVLGLAGVNMINNPSWPTWAQAILTWTPGSIMARLMTFAMANTIEFTQLVLNAAILFCVGLIFYGLDAWLILKYERI